MHDKQLDVFWKVICPKCKEEIDLEILINAMKLKENK